MILAKPSQIDLIDALHDPGQALGVPSHAVVMASNLLSFVPLSLSPPPLDDPGQDLGAHRSAVRPGGWARL
jgi:hypothetical protein